MRIQSLAIMTMFITAMACVYLIFTSPEYTAQYTRYAAARTAIRQAEEQTERVQAEQWSNAVRSIVPWTAGGLAAVVVAGVGGWAVVEWQRNRTRRHEVTEDNTTQRYRLGAQRDIVLAYLAQFGEPGAMPMLLNGVRGAYLPSSNEFVPEDVCRAELAQYQQPQRERRFKVVGERD